MGKQSKTLWIARTAILIAFLVASQFATSGFSTLVTGSIVNMILIVSVITCGLSTGLTVAMISPIAAKLINIGPLWALIPFIALGNITLILIWHFVCKTVNANKYMHYIISLIVGSIGKFIVLYLGIVKFAIPILLSLPEKQAIAISAIFSFPQLVTALIGGALAIMILPVVKKAMRSTN